ncbi:hypothetical protein J1N35_007183 [Gossypium stocksii]|uniref:RNase H type-1 domain-containing protein n=1 Tax=Gossypium stocksii TaxID=47602 RepID=A0A9D4AFC3_9ROSI|nr:hypothetical protein J1N35_007183 [Gossypium stocksii]
MLLEGLLVAWFTGFRKVIVETDCAHAVTCINSSLKASSALGVINNIRELCNQQWKVQFGQVQREANCATDNMANLVVASWYVDVVRFNLPPRSIIFAVRDDLISSSL